MLAPSAAAALDELNGDLEYVAETVIEGNGATVGVFEFVIGIRLIVLVADGLGLEEALDVSESVT